MKQTQDNILSNNTELRVEKRSGGVCIITLDGPATRNSIGRPQYEALRSAIIEAGRDPEIGAIVLQGAAAFFSSGGNVNALKQSRSMSMVEVSKNTDALGAMILAIRACPTPVIAAIEGGAAGLGVSLALSCDMLVATASAQFTAAYVKIGLTPDGGATHFLKEALPRQLVSEMCMLGRPINAVRLHQAGVVNILADEGEALSKALELAGECARGAPAAIAVIKSEIGSAARNDLATQLEIEARNINEARYGAEAKEGLQAFLEKRRPEFGYKAAVEEQSETAGQPGLNQ